MGLVTTDLNAKSGEHLILYSVLPKSLEHAFIFIASRLIEAKHPALVNVIYSFPLPVPLIGTSTI